MTDDKLEAMKQKWETEKKDREYFQLMLAKANLKILDLIQDLERRKAPATPLPPKKARLRHDLEDLWFSSVKLGTELERIEKTLDDQRQILKDLKELI